MSETDTTFEPSQFTTYPISWESEAGTVYSGSLDVTTGLLTVDKVNIEVTKDSDNLAYFSSGNSFLGIQTSIYPKDHQYEELPDGLYCDKLPSITRKNIKSNDITGICYEIDTSRLDINITGITSLNDYILWLTDNPLQIVYKIATPITYQLTPTQITTLLGQNNIWADTGNIDITYIKNTLDGALIKEIKV